MGNFNLFNELSEQMNNNSKLYGYYESFPMIKTGLTPFDYLNAEAIVKDDGSTKCEIGVDAGKIITVIGKSGSGKSTFAIQLGYGIIKQYEQGTMIVLDFEQATDPERIRMVTGMSEKEYSQRVSIKRIGISTDSVYRTIMAIRKLKVEHEKDLLVPDPNGSGKMVLPPSVLIIDSLAMMMPEDRLGEDELGGGMDATKAAKANTALFKSIAQPCQEANIIPIFINHINSKISTSIVPTQAQTMYLGQDETLPGGNAAIYLSNTLIRITTGTKLDETKLYQIKGFEATCMLVKSRSAEAGKVTKLIFDQRSGFDNDLSILENIKAAGFLKGGGLGYFLEGFENQKFRLSNFKEKLAENAEFRSHFYELGEAVLRSRVTESNRIQVAKEEEVIVDDE